MKLLGKNKLINSWSWGITVLTLFLSTTPVSLAAETSSQLVNGVTYFKDTTASGRDLRALVVDPAVVTVRPEGKASCGAKFSHDQFVALGNEANVVGLINANFFNSSVLGDYIGNQVYLGPAGSAAFFAIKNDGSFELSSGRLDQARASQYKMFLGGIYRIDSDAKPLAQMTEADINARFAQIYTRDVSDAQGRIARTFLGVNVSERKLILFTGGQGQARNQGVTPQEGIDFLKRHGATAAYNLDSGSSTLMRLNSRLSAADQGGSTLGDDGLATLLVVRTDAGTTSTNVVNCRSSQDANTTTAVSQNNPADGSSNGTASVPQQVVVPVGAVPLEAPINGSTSVSAEGGVILNYARILFNYAAGLAGTLALLMLIVSGIQIIMGGSGDGISKAKERIVGVLSGLFILGSGGYILYLINPCFFTFGTGSACQVRSTRYENPNFQTSGVNQFVSGPAGQGTAATSTRTRARSPQVYAQEKLSMMKSWWTTYNADILRISRALAPNAAPEFFMGVASNGSLRENTTGFRTGLAEERAAGTNPPLGGVATQSFHELGWFGVEGGSRNGPAPAPDSNWSRIATSQEVRTLLGREGVTAPGSWYEAVPDQLAIGIINNRNHGRAVNQALPANLQARDESSLWFEAMTTLGWSAGDARAARIIRMVANDIGNVPENQRWGALVRAFYTKGLDRSILPVQEGGVYDVYNNPFFAIIRTMQKIEAGLALARDHGGNVAYFDDGLGADRQQIHTTLTNLAFYGTATGQ